MSAVAGFIADSKACAKPGLGLVSAGAQSEGQAWSGGIAASGSSTVQNGTANGGSDWRAQFMALVQGTGTPVATETATGNAATDSGETGVESVAAATTVPTAPAATSALATESALRWRLAAAEGSKSASEALPAAGTGRSALRTPVSADQQIAADGGTTADGAAVAGTRPLRSTTSSETAKGKSSKQETDSDQTVSATAQASTGNDLLAQVVPQAATWAAGAVATAPQQAQAGSPSTSATGATLSLPGTETVVAPSAPRTTGSAYAVASEPTNTTGNSASAGTATSTTGAALRPAGTSPVVSTEPGATTGSGYTVAGDVADEAGKSAAIASPASTKDSSSLAASSTLPAGATGLDKPLETAESGPNDSLAATTVVSDTVRTEARGTQKIVDPEQPQIAAMSETNSGSNSENIFDASVAASTSAGQVAPSIELKELNLAAPATAPVAISTSAQSGLAVAPQDVTQTLAGQTAATAAAPLLDGAAASRVETDTAGGAAGGETAGLSESKAELAFPKTAAHSGQTVSQVHTVVPAATGETNTVSPSTGKADATDSADAQSAVTAVASSPLTQSQTTDTQQPSVQGQELSQTQVVSQTQAVRQASESAAVANASNESSQATGLAETAGTKTSAAISQTRKPAGTGAGNMTARATAQPASSATATEPVAHLVHSQSGAAISEASNLQGYLAVPRDAAGTNGGTSLSATNSSAGSAGDATFAALDSASGAAAPSWTHVGARHAEAGFQDPSLGWVGVRADVSAGAVHATVVPGSADAAQALGGHMAGLNSYLSDEHAHVETLTLAVPESKDSWAGSGQGSGQGMNQDANQGANQGAGQGTGQESGQNRFSESASSVQSVTPVRTTAASEAQVSAGALNTNGSSGSLRQGSHISVMA
ncbi:MAG: hypothetical protein P4L40_17545 [Terracidiphilus sp.]|nr:hypothetical protein [Terracidiphilus sp.]